MEVLKRLAPNYWLGYYAVYVVVFTYLAVVFRDSLAKWPELEKPVHGGRHIRGIHGRGAAGGGHHGGSGIHGSPNTEKSQRAQRGGAQGGSR